MSWWTDRSCVVYRREATDGQIRSYNPTENCDETTIILSSTFSFSTLSTIPVIDLDTAVWKPYWRHGARRFAVQ